MKTATLADPFPLWLKTNDFHRHMSGSHFRDNHLLLNEQSEPIFAMTNPIADRVRKTGIPTPNSIGQIARTQRVSDDQLQ